jgi:hypothetical protein
MEIPKTRKELFEILRQHNSGDRSDRCGYLKDYVTTEIGLQNLSREELRSVRNTISRFCSKLFQKWEDCQRKNDRFVRENAIWLEQKEVLPVHVPAHEEESSRHPVEDFRSVKQKNEKEENGSCTKKFLDGEFSLRYSDEPSRIRKCSCLKPVA